MLWHTFWELKMVPTLPRSRSAKQQMPSSVDKLKSFDIKKQGSEIGLFFAIHILTVLQTCSIIKMCVSFCDDYANIMSAFCQLQCQHMAPYSQWLCYMDTQFSKSIVIKFIFLLSLFFVAVLFCKVKYFTRRQWQRRPDAKSTTTITCVHKVNYSAAMASR